MGTGCELRFQNGVKKCYDRIRRKPGQPKSKPLMQDLTFNVKVSELPVLLLRPLPQGFVVRPLGFGQCTVEHLKKAPNSLQPSKRLKNEDVKSHSSGHGLTDQVSAASQPLLAAWWLDPRVRLSVGRNYQISNLSTLSPSSRWYFNAILSPVFVCL